MNHWDQYGFGPLMWFDKLTRQFIGRGGLRSRIIEEKPEVELAYAMIPEAWGKGLAAEMSLPSLQFAFEMLNLTDIICFTQTKNAQSLAVMQKIGFLYEKDFTYFNLPHKLYRLKNPPNAIVNP
jgi:RimJ/RimL family protein N-acetyltransferase